MRDLKLLLKSGAALCVMYLIMQTLYSAESLVDETQHLTQELYSPSDLALHADAQDSDADEEENETSAPKSAPATQPAATPAPQPAPAAKPATAPEKSATPAAPAPAPTASTPAKPAPADAAKTAPTPATPAASTPAAPAPAAEKSAPAPAAPATPTPAAPAPATAPAAPAAPTPAPAAAAAPSAPAPAPAPAAVPAAPKAVPAPAPKQEEVERPLRDEDRVGIDTIDLKEPSGNWLYKRIWWERAQNRYEQIKGVFDQILEMRMPFFRRRAEIDRKVLEPLYVSAGLDQVEIARVLEKLNTLLDIEQEKHKVLEEHDRIMREKILEEKKMLDQLHADIVGLTKYETALDDFLDKLMEQVSTARNYEKNAWQAYKDIGKELNDKRARELYLGMDTPFKGLTDIAQYIQGVFKQDFDKIDATVQEHANRIKESLQSLKEKDVDLKAYSKHLDEKVAKEGEVKEEQPTEQEEPAEGGILATLAAWWNIFTDTLYSVFESLMSYISGSSAETQEEEKPKKEPEPVAEKAEKTAEPAITEEKPA